MGGDYLLTIYDLHSGILANEHTLFYSLAETIQRKLHINGWNIKTFAIPSTQNSTTTTYTLFNLWLKQVQKILAQKKRILILAFDNFIIPEAPANKAYNLLLNWFNSFTHDDPNSTHNYPNSTHNYPNIALILCGTQRSDEIHKRLARPLPANFRTLPISFLQHNEANNVITLLAPKRIDNQEFFSMAVKQEIIRLTNGHPFLLQASCYALIEYINQLQQETVTLSHVEQTTAIICSQWEAYFINLWNTFDKEQKDCLQHLSYNNGRDSLKNIDKALGWGKDYAYRTLQTLIKRDIVRISNNQYEITIPLLAKFLAHKH